MIHDLDMIKKVYATMAERIVAARNVVKRPLTLTEKILYSHLSDGAAQKAFERGKSYVDFAPDRVAMQSGHDQANKYSANISQLRMKPSSKTPLQNLHANAFLVTYRSVKA